MAKATPILCGLWVVLLVLPDSTAHAQRVRFPSMVTVNSASAADSTGSAEAGTSSPAAAETVPRWSPSPTLVAMQNSVYAPQTLPSPTLSNQTYGPVPAYGTPPAGPGPMTAPGGGILPPSTWDPNAAAGIPQPQPLMPYDPTLPTPAFPPPELPFGADVTFENVRRFLAQLQIDYTWMNGHGEHQLGINDVELRATFAVPIFGNPQTPLFVAPGFGMHFFEGPVTTPVQQVELPGRTYDAFLDTSWHPQATPWLGADLGFRIGVYSDFTEVVGSSIRYTGNGLAVISLSPSMKIKAGVIYLDRVRVRMLPAGGLIWSPNGDLQFEILFPNPRIRRRLATINTTQWWLYLRGEYGGGSWTVKRTLLPDQPIDKVDYNDERVALGVEFEQPRGTSGLFEVGVAFDREVLYQSTDPPTFRPNTTVFIRAVLGF